jgi:quercetin dioxygenase-like cupin family protein
MRPGAAGVQEPMRPGAAGVQEPMRPGAAGVQAPDARTFSHHRYPRLARGWALDTQGESSMSEEKLKVAVSTYDDDHLYHLDGRDFQLLLGPQTGESERMTMSIATFPPGSRPPLHVHPKEEEQVFVISGRGKFLTEDDSIQLEPGVAIRVPVGIRHGSINDGDETLRLLCMFNPPVVPGSYEPRD